MFTGIVHTTGTVTAVDRHAADITVTIAAATDFTAAIAIGDSIAVHGICLSATAVAPGTVTFDASAETIARTTIGDWRAGTVVNLETAMRVGDTIGGHLVSGHVDAVATIAAVTVTGRSTAVSVHAPAAIAKFIAAKGAVCMDGVSLTVNTVRDDVDTVDTCEFTVNIIPHTAAVAAVDYAIGARVNVEVDLVARHLARLVECAT